METENLREREKHEGNKIKLQSLSLWHSPSFSMSKPWLMFSFTCYYFFIEIITVIIDAHADYWMLLMKLQCMDNPPLAPPLSPFKAIGRVGSIKSWQWSSPSYHMTSHLLTWTHSTPLKNNYILFFFCGVIWNDFIAW